MSGTRPFVLAGSWYPADPDRLAAEVDRYLAGADPTAAPVGRPRLAIVPHAGYAYSGPVAGKVFGLLADWPFGRIVMMAPNHRTPLELPALSGAERFVTPLGRIDVDTAAVAELAATGAFVIHDRAHADEHAIEIQLPLMQRTWRQEPPSIVPVLVPRLDPAARRSAATALGRLLDDDTLLLVSTDFTHFGAAYGFLPFTEDIPASLERLDSGAIIRILGADPEGLLAYGKDTRITMCGLEAAALALECGLPAGYEGALLDYRRSGDRDHDYSLSVSYAAILLTAGSVSRPTPEDAHV